MPGHTTELPLELLLEITHNVISKEDLCQLRCVNWLFETLATPEIFNSITVHNNKQSVDKFWSLLRTSRIATHIQSISFVEDYTVTIPEKEVRERLEDAFSILHQASGLKTLELHFCLLDKYFDDIVVYYSHQWDIVNALRSNRNPIPALQSLKIDGWLCDKDELMLLFDDEPVADLAASSLLRLLSFAVFIIASTDEVRSESFEWFWKQVVVRHVLQPVINRQLQIINFPRLAALSLRRIIWKDDTIGQALEFIVRHKKTLKKLELHDCAINVRERYGPPHCYWADIYKRLANALTGLVELKVDVELEYKIPYVYFAAPTYYAYLKKDDLKKGRASDAALAQDALALEEFRAVVKSRGVVARCFDRDAKHGR